MCERVFNRLSIERLRALSREHAQYSLLASTELCL